MPHPAAFMFARCITSTLYPDHTIQFRSLQNKHLYRATGTDFILLYIEYQPRNYAIEQGPV